MDYPHLRAWDRMMGSHDYWKEAMLARARREKAPADAVYHTGGWATPGRWVTFGEVAAPDTRRLIEEMVNAR